MSLAGKKGMLTFLLLVMAMGKNFYVPHETRASDEDELCADNEWTAAYEDDMNKITKE